MAMLNNQRVASAERNICREPCEHVLEIPGSWEPLEPLEISKHKKEGFVVPGSPFVWLDCLTLHMGIVQILPTSCGLPLVLPHENRKKLQTGIEN